MFTIIVFACVSSFAGIVQAEETPNSSMSYGQSKASVILTEPNQNDTLKNSGNNHLKEDEVNPKNDTDPINSQRKPEGRLNQKKPFGRLPSTGEFQSLLSIIIGINVLLAVYILSFKKKNEKES